MNASACMRPIIGSVSEYHGQKALFFRNRRCINLLCAALPFLFALITYWSKHRCWKIYGQSTLAIIMYSKSTLPIQIGSRFLHKMADAGGQTPLPGGATPGPLSQQQSSSKAPIIYICGGTLLLLLRKVVIVYKVNKS